MCIGILCLKNIMEHQHLVLTEFGINLIYLIYIFHTYLLFMHVEYTNNFRRDVNTVISRLDLLSIVRVSSVK